MKPLSIIVLLALAAQVEDPRVTRAKQLLDALNKAEWKKVGKHFDKTMKEQFTPEKSQELWETVTKQIGKLKKIERVDTSKVANSTIIDLVSQFDKTTITVRVSFNEDDEIEGFFLRPATPLKFDPPPYAKKDAYREENFIVGEDGEYPLPATLTLPKGAGPFPCVVLVHGSGPLDRDQTIGPNKPFRDLAWGLASQGIAILRFDKRTLTHGAKMLASGQITLDNEVVDDALLAADAVSKHKAINPKKIFILGHSLGAIAAPRVGEKMPTLAGLILLAGNSRPLEDLIIEQFSYIYSLEGELTERHKADLAELKKKVDRVKHHLSNDTSAEDLPLGLPASYWKSLKEYDQKATAAKLSIPLLILQGERDYQVTMEDFAGWKKALAGRKQVTFKSYPNLNHLFMVGKGKATPAEYGVAGHVAREVIDDVATWLKKQ